DERARENTGRPAREVVALEPLPQIHADVGDNGDGFERDAAAFALASQARSEGIPVRHCGYKSRAILTPHADAGLLRGTGSSRRRGNQSCNRGYRTGNRELPL